MALVRYSVKANIKKSGRAEQLPSLASDHVQEIKSHDDLTKITGARYAKVVKPNAELRTN